MKSVKYPKEKELQSSNIIFISKFIRSSMFARCKPVFELAKILNSFLNLILC